MTSLCCYISLNTFLERCEKLNHFVHQSYFSVIIKYSSIQYSFFSNWNGNFISILTFHIFTALLLSNVMSKLKKLSAQRFNSNTVGCEK